MVPLRVTRRTAGMGAGAALLGLAILGILAWNLGTRLISPAHRAVEIPDRDLPVLSLSIPSDSGSTIAAWHAEAKGSVATVILAHPIRSNRRSMWSRAKLLHEAGYSVLLIDMQAHGESPGEAITVGALEAHDVRAAVGYVRAQAPPHRIAVIGSSLGGAATIFASPLEIDAVVLESIYPTIEQAVSNRIALRLGSMGRLLAPILLYQLELRLGIPVESLRPIEQVDRLQCPVLVLAGSEDRHTTLNESRELFDAAREPKRLEIFEGAAHVDLLRFDASTYGETVLSFLAPLLDPQPELPGTPPETSP